MPIKLGAEQTHKASVRSERMAEGRAMEGRAAEAYAANPDHNEFFDGMDPITQQDTGSFLPPPPPDDADWHYHWGLYGTAGEPNFQYLVQLNAKTRGRLRWEICPVDHPAAMKYYVGQMQDQIATKLTTAKDSRSTSDAIIIGANMLYRCPVTQWRKYKIAEKAFNRARTSKHRADTISNLRTLSSKSDDFRVDQDIKEQRVDAYAPVGAPLPGDQFPGE